MGIYRPTIDNLLIHNEYVTMPGYSQSRSPLFPRPKWFVNTLPPFMPDIGGFSQKYGGGGVKGGGGGGGGYQCRVQVPLRPPAKGYERVLRKLELCELINLITITFHYQLSVPAIDIWRP